MNGTNRRSFVKLAAATAIAPAIAGCGSDTGGNGNGNGNGGSGGDAPQAIADHLDGANQYDGSVDDQTGSDEVTVSVGAGDTGLAYDPAAVRVDAGTTVVWEWTGEGGQHNVASTDDSDGEFSSDMYGSEGETFEQTFDSAGNMLYVCEPHEAQGMKGAVEVVE